jgi:hypothetical protein
MQRYLLALLPTVLLSMLVQPESRPWSLQPVALPHMPTATNLACMSDNF